MCPDFIEDRGLQAANEKAREFGKIEALNVPGSVKVIIEL